MQLYLVQHGASKSESDDPQRGLTDEGRQTVEQMADHLSLLELALDRIEHSEKLRARQTAEIMAERLRPRQGTKHEDLLVQPAVGIGIQPSPAAPP